jgi:OTU domain-containing protein 5
MHYEVRQRCCDFMAKDEAHFSQFINDEIFTDYVERKRQDGVHANNPEIQAIAELFSRPVEVYTEESGPEPINIFQSDYKDQFPIRLSYHDGNHYNAIVDPLVPTAGLGLGMPGLKPGLADKLQLSKAIIRSDEDEDVERALKESCQTANSQQSDDLQRALKESAMADNRLETAIFKSDVDATNFELEQAVLESSIGGKIPARPYLPIAFSSTPSVASIPADVPLVASLPSSEVWSEEYPPTVQELVMNGFEIQKVVRAYELIGDSFDDLLAFLVSNQSS